MLTLLLHSIDNFGGPPTLVSAYLQVFSKALPYALVFVALWWIFDKVVFERLCGFGASMPERGGARRSTWALKTAMLIHHGLVTPLAMKALFDDPAIAGMYKCVGCAEFATRMNRDTNPSVAARVLIPITLGYFLGDLLLLREWNLSKSGAVENGLMMMHHVASLVVWPAAVYFDWVSRYVLNMLSYEFTSFWLTVMWMLSTAQMKSTLSYKIVGFIFTSSFVILRMFGAVPQILALWAMPPWAAEVETKVQPGGIHQWCWIFSLSLVLPHLLNLFWGVKVVSGFLQVVAGRSKKSE